MENINQIRQYTDVVKNQLNGQNVNPNISLREKNREESGTTRVDGQTEEESERERTKVNVTLTNLK